MSNQDFLTASECGDLNSEKSFSLTKKSTSTAKMFKYTNINDIQILFFLFSLYLQLFMEFNLDF